MSLSMLKTHNLTWQDHTLNVEVMMAPQRSQLLLNKHKTLDSKCMKNKTLLDREQNTFLKDHITGKRKYNRIKAKLDDKRRQILATKSIPSVQESKRDVLRSFSAPPHLEPRSKCLNDEQLPSQKNRPSTMEGTRIKSRASLKYESKVVLETKSVEKRDGSNQIDDNLNSGGESVFLTQFSTPQPEKVSKPKYINTRLTHRPQTKSFSKQHFLERVMSEQKSLKSVKFGDDLEETAGDKYMDRKIHDFIVKMMQFNSEEAPPLSPKFINYFVKPDGTVSRRFAATLGQYNSLLKDSDSLLQAFENFCQKRGDKTDFHKFIKYVSRCSQGAGRQTRSLSSAPVITASRKDMLQRKDTNANVFS